MSRAHPFRRSWSPTPEARSANLLHHELSFASMALNDALTKPVAREAKLREAREALEAFDLLQRASRDFFVPRDVRRRVRWALDALDGNHVELAHSDLNRAGGELERWMMRRPTA